MGAPLQLFRYPFIALDAPCDIQVFAASSEDASHASDLAMGEIIRLERQYARRTDSVLAELNRAAAEGGEVTVNAETASLLDHAARAWSESGGRFDITASVLRHVWRFEGGSPPEPDALAARMEKVGWDKVRWQAPVLGFSVAGMEIYFGLLLRQYAVDRAANALRAAGIEHGIVNFGGDVHVVGPREGGEGWHVGVRGRPQAEGMVNLITLAEGAMATVGDGERPATINGERVARMFNAKTGWPVRAMAQATVIDSLCANAGTLASIAMSMEDEGPAWLTAHAPQHLWVGVNGDSGGPLAAA